MPSSGIRRPPKRRFRKIYMTGSIRTPVKVHGKTPAKGRHAEKKNAQGQEFLPERRMRKLIRPDIMKMLPRGAGVVNLVKIAGIVIGLLLRDEVPLVMQVFLAAGKGDALARPVKKDQFPSQGVPDSQRRRR